MDVTFFIATLSNGGAEHQLTILANKLSENGHNVTITTFADAPDHYPINKSIKRVRIAEGNSNIKKLVGIWKYILTMETDWFIPFCQRNSFLSLMPLMFRSKRKIKALCGERNMTIGKPSLYEKWLTGFLYRRANYVVSNSHSQLKYLTGKQRWLDPKLRTIINFTDLDHYKVTPIQDSEILRIGVFARYAPQKNCIRFCEAISRVNSIAERKFEVHWYGNKTVHGSDTNPSYVEFERKVKELGLVNIIFLHDHVKDTSEYISNMDVICLPSLFEGFSNSIAEAICCGRPIVCSDVSDNGVMVHSEENGFLFDPNNLDSMVDAIMRLFALDYKELLKMSERSRDIAYELFSGDIFINSYTQLLTNKPIES